MNDAEKARRVFDAAKRNLVDSHKGPSVEAIEDAETLFESALEALIKAHVEADRYAQKQAQTRNALD